MSKIQYKIVNFMLQIYLDFVKVFPDEDSLVKDSFATKYTKAILDYCKKNYPSIFDQVSNIEDGLFVL